MDPVSQGAVGAVVACCFARKDSGAVRLAILVGWAAGMLADADIFIHSEEDTLLQIQYHRHFTHSLIFIPLGGLICASILWLFLRRKVEFVHLFGLSTAGYATAGLLDACTSYGTQLLWPFSDERIGWHIISIVDPVFTVTILVLLFMAWKTRHSKWSRIAAIFIGAYLSFGCIQFFRAQSVQEEMIAKRGHSGGVSMANVKPTIGNLVLWRSVYRYKGNFFADGIRQGVFSKGRGIDGNSVMALEVSQLKEGMDPECVLARDLDRFDHFSAGYLARHPEQPDVIGDLRYAILPTSVTPLWGIRYNPEEVDEHVSFESFREAGNETRDTYFRMLFEQ